MNNVEASSLLGNFSVVSQICLVYDDSILGCQSEASVVWGKPVVMCSRWFSVCQTVRVTDSISAVKEFKVILLI